MPRYDDEFDDRDDDRDDDYQRPRRRGSGGAPHRGTMILVFGILSWFCCAIFGIVAYFMGKGDLAEMKAGRMDSEGEGLTRVGMILGLISVILNVIGVIIYALMIFVFGAIAVGAK